jgi:hypothetical protein
LRTAVGRECLTYVVAMRTDILARYIGTEDLNGHLLSDAQISEEHLHGLNPILLHEARAAHDRSSIPSEHFC